MARNSNTITNIPTNIYIQTPKQWPQQAGLLVQRRILAVFMLLCCNAVLPTTVAAIERHVNSSAKAIDVDMRLAVGATTAAGDGTMATNSPESLQLPHTPRHQERYTHRVTHSVSDLNRTHWQQQPIGNCSNSTANTSSGHIYIRYESQLQPQPSAHLRHHNQRHHSLGANTAWARYALPPLRHQRHQQQHHYQVSAPASEMMVPSVSSSSPTPLVPRTAATNEQVKKYTSTDFKANGNSDLQQQIKPHRYFDRDGLFQSPYMWTTRGPKVHAAKDSWQQLDLDNMRIDGRRQANSQRISLDLSAKTYEHLDGWGKNVEDGESGENAFNDENLDDKASDNYDSHVVKDGSDDDDYLYDDSLEEDARANEFLNAAHMHSSEHRPTIKRYTDSFDDLRMPPKKRAHPYPFSMARRSTANERTDVGNEHADYGADMGRDTDADADDNENGADFSSEKWQRIEQEHHRKQQEHQRQMQVLRTRHGRRYRPTEVGATLVPTIGATLIPVAAKVVHEHSNDDDDADDIGNRYYIPGTLTRHKQEELGTLAAVQESRRAHAIKHKHEKALAGEHVKQILSEATCRIPQRRIERIQKDPSKMYMPHCTVLHRCTDETGCCRSERQTCAPKRTKNVDLYFYVRSINEKRGSVERLTFINHTECHCVDKSRQQVDEYHNQPMYELPYGVQPLRRATILNCNCPKLYEKILQEDGFCRCDCSSGNTGCDWLKRGMEHFSMIDRKCISEGRCKPPTCEHGNYIRKYGRCPRREEQLSASLTGPAMLVTNALPNSDYH